MGKGKNNVKMNVLRNISTQVHLKEMWQRYLKIELPLISVGVVWGKKMEVVTKREKE